MNTSELRKLIHQDLERVSGISFTDKKIKCVRCNTENCGRHINLYRDEFHPDSWKRICESLKMDAADTGYIFLPFFSCEQHVAKPKGRGKIYIEKGDFLDDETFYSYSNVVDDLDCLYFEIIYIKEKLDKESCKVDLTEDTESCKVDLTEDTDSCKADLTEKCSLFITPEELLEFFGEDSIEEISEYLASNMNSLLNGHCTPQEYVTMHIKEDEEDED